MSTAIEWTDETWNPVVGCTKVSQGCKHCYAKTLHDKRHKAAVAGKAIHPQYLKPFELVQLMPERLEAPRHWRKPRRVFVNSVSDVFHEDVPDEFIAQIWATMAVAYRHTFQVLTKRPARMQELLHDEQFYGLVYAFIDEIIGETVDPHNRRTDDARAVVESPDREHPVPNVWLGVSVEDQEAANERIPLLLQTPAAMRFLSCEPLLGPLDLSLWLEEEGFVDENYVPPVDWVIVGGESGAGARPCDLGWIEAIVADCDLNGIACFVKQLGANPVCRNDWHTEDWPGASAPLADDYEPHHQGEIAPLALRNRKGGDPAEWPESLRVREFPAPRVPA